jgi:hypothetical protein
MEETAAEPTLAQLKEENEKLRQQVIKGRVSLVAPRNARVM